MKSAAIEALLNRLWRLRLARMLLQIILLAAGGYFLARLADAVSEKYLVIPPWIWPALALPIAILLIVRTVLLWAAAKRLQLAQELDSRHELKDRLTTYVQFEHSGHPFLEPLIQETEAHLQPVSILRSARWLDGTHGPLGFVLVPALLLAVLPLLPVPRSLADRIDQHKKIAQEAKKLQQKSRELEKQAEKLPELKKLAGQMDQLAKELQKPSTDPADALKKMNAMQEHLKDAKNLSDKTRKDQLSKDLDRMSKGGKTSGELSESEKKQLQQMTRELEQSLADQNLEGGKEMQDALKNGALSKDQMERMKKSMEQYQQEKAETEKRMAELQKSLENTKKSAAQGKTKVTYNSKLDDRKVETGKSGVEDGPGTTNQDAGPQKFDTQKHGKGEYAEDKTKAEYEQLYKGERTKAGDDPLFLNGQWDPQNARFTRIRSFGVNSDGSDSGGVSETVVQNEGESVIRKEKVPASYRNLVKKYFDSIQK